MKDLDQQIESYKQRMAEAWAQIGVTPSLSKDEAHEMGRVKQAHLAGFSVALELGKLLGILDCIEAAWACEKMGGDPAQFMGITHTDLNKKLSALLEERQP